MTKTKFTGSLAIKRTRVDMRRATVRRLCLRAGAVMAAPTLVDAVNDDMYAEAASLLREAVLLAEHRASKGKGQTNVLQRKDIQAALERRGVVVYG
jgi:histone H3/H4